MNFASWPFLALFLPLVLGGFFALRGPRAPGLRQTFLIAASLVFYGVSGLDNLALLGISILFNYGAGRLLAREPRLSLGARRLVMWSAIAANVALLAGFKYAALEAETFDGFLSSPRILIPLALSFITFQQIGFVVSCHRGQVKDPDFFTYLFFIAFFPQLILGPILQYPMIREQLRAGALARGSLDNVAIGLAILVYGLAKKVLLADPLSRPVDNVFTQASMGLDVSAADAWFAIAAFQLQLYFDFSGYADMAIGLGRMFGINLPINFDRPLHAVDRFDLWRRWHITFVTFMRGNVFLPLVRHWHFAPAAALAANGLLSGLWHGLGLTFLLWALIQTSLMLALHWRSKWRRRTPGGGGRLGLVWAIASTFAITCLVGAMFRSPSVAAAGEIYRSLFLLDVPDVGAAAPGLALVAPGDLAQLGLAAAIGWFWPDAQRLFARYWTAIDPRPAAAAPVPAGAAKGRIRFALTPAWGAAVALLLVAVLVRLAETDRFVYVQF